MTRWTIPILVVLTAAIFAYRALEEGADEELELPNAGPLHPAAVPPPLPPPPSVSSRPAVRSMRVLGTLEDREGRHRLEWERGQEVRVLVEEPNVHLVLVSPSGERTDYDQSDMEVPETGVWVVLVRGRPGDYTLRVEVL